MKTMNLKPAFTYRFLNNIKGIGIFILIMILIFVLMSVSFVTFLSGGNSSMHFSAFTIASAITMFIVGIVSIREDLRLFLQNGIGRKTVFLTALFSSFAAALSLAVAGELLLRAEQALTAAFSGFTVTDMFYLFFTPGKDAAVPFSLSLLSALFSFLLITCASLSGIFISLLFYRLNKAWTLIVAIGGPILLFNGIPFLLYRCRVSLQPFIRFLFSSPWTAILFLLVVAALFALIDFLLLRRAPVKPVK